MAGKKSAEKTIKIVVNTLVWLFVVFAIVITVLAFAAQSDPDGVPAIGGKCILTVQSDSMKGVFNKGDIIIAEKLSDKEKSELAVKDIISFKTDLNGDGVKEINSHRITEVIKGENGEISYKTMGDNTLGEDSGEVAAADVIGKYNGTRIKGLGGFLDFLQKPKGFLVVVVIPLILFFVFELANFIKTFIQVKNGDKKQITAEDEALIRKQAVEEYLRQQKAAADSNVENSSDAADIDK